MERVLKSFIEFTSWTVSQYFSIDRYLLRMTTSGMSGLKVLSPVTLLPLFPPNLFVCFYRRLCCTFIISYNILHVLYRYTSNVICDSEVPSTLVRFVGRTTFCDCSRLRTYPCERKYKKVCREGSGSCLSGQLGFNRASGWKVMTDINPCTVRH